MKPTTHLRLVPREGPQAATRRPTPSVSEMNRAGVYSGDIVAFVACLSFDFRDAARPFDSLRLASVLRDQLSAIAGRVPDDTFAAIATVCGELLNDGAQANLADHLANIAVSKAKSGVRT